MINNIAILLSGNNVVPEGNMDKFMYGLQIALIGMGFVFAILALLMLVIYLFKLIFYKDGNKKANTAPATVPVTVNAEEDDSEIAAIIGAVIAAYYNSENLQSNVQSRKNYRITSFKRIY